MAWVRLHDGAMTHPKVVGLSDAAFRLWVWGLSYCQQHLTDGWIPPASLPAKCKPDALVSARLWHYAAQGGFAVHDYLDWNDSRETIQKKRASLRERVSRYRGADTARARNASAPSGVVNSSDLTTTKDSEGESEGKPSAVPAFVGKQRPLPGYRRLKVFPWMVDELIGMLGDSAFDFDIDAWLLRLDASGDVLPPNLWPWMKDAVSADAARRGFGAASTNGHTNIDAVRDILRRDGVIE